MAKTLTLVLGGARSGKSAFAQHLAAGAGRVLFVATAQPGDADMAARIRAHQARRPAEWRTLEEPVALAGAIPKKGADVDLVLIDCLTLWVSNLLLSAPSMSEADAGAEAQRLLAAYGQDSASWVIVSNEVGLGVVPPTAIGGRYRDLLGRVNQELAQAADRIYLMVAGLAIDLTALGAKPWQRG